LQEEPKLSPGALPPSRARGYLQLLKPRIVLLNVFVAAVAMFLAWNGRVEPVIFTITLFAGATAVAGSGAINCFLERDLDGQMARTRTRALPSGRVAPNTAFLLGAILIIASLTVSAIFVNLLTSGFITLGIATYLVVYTLWLKKRSIHNIVIGGFAGSCSALAGWAAATNSVSLFSALLAILIFLWTPGHFWPLALSLKDDYANANIPMLPVTLGERGAVRVIAASNFLVVAFTFSFIIMQLSGLIYVIVASIFGGLMVAWNIRLLQLRTKAASWRVFKLSSVYLIALMAAMAFSEAIF